MKQADQLRIVRAAFVLARRSTRRRAKYVWWARAAWNDLEKLRAAFAEAGIDASGLPPRDWSVKPLWTTRERLAPAPDDDEDAAEREREEKYPPNDPTRYTAEEEA